LLWTLKVLWVFFYFLGVKAREEMARERLWYLESVKYVNSITTSIRLISTTTTVHTTTVSISSANVASRNGI
jgi:hypothetical protein